VDLAWTASTSSGVTGYDIYRGTASGGPYTQINSSSVAGTTYTDSTVAAGQAYYYVATAVNSSGTQSGYSNQASATVPSP
jgi:fibronectin type 3 domain-containing protein